MLPMKQVIKKVINLLIEFKLMYKTLVDSQFLNKIRLAQVV